MAEIVILGSGLTGLSAAYHLEKNNFFDFELFEKDSNIGGLCRSIYKDGFTFDYTGHLLHINNEYFDNFIQENVGYHKLNSIFRKSYIYSNEVYTRYPFQINLYGLPQEVIIECIKEYINRPIKIKKPKTFYSWVQKKFGKGFGKYFFFPFQKKIFDYDIRKITSSWTGRFVPQTSIEDILKGSLFDRKDESFGYNSQFFYPKYGGIYYLIQKINKNLKNKPKTMHEAISIDIKNKQIYFKNGKIKNYNILITTIPLDILLKIIKEPSNITLSDASKKLICNSVLNFNLGIERENLTDKHWIYFPETKYPFYRIGFPHNFTSSMVPDGCSSLYGEFSFTKKSKNYIENKAKEAKYLAKKLLNIDDKEIKTEVIIPISHAYVIFNQWREKNLEIILKKLKSYNIFSVGRYGQWKYSSMQEGVLDGKTIAERILKEYKYMNYYYVSEDLQRFRTEFKSN